MTLTGESEQKRTAAAWLAHDKQQMHLFELYPLLVLLEIFSKYFKQDSKPDVNASVCVVDPFPTSRDLSLKVSPANVAGSKNPTKSEGIPENTLLNNLLKNATVSECPKWPQRLLLCSKWLWAWWKLIVEEQRRRTQSGCDWKETSLTMTDHLMARSRCFSNCCNTSAKKIKKTLCVF